MYNAQRLMETGSFKVNEISTVLGNLSSTFNFFFASTVRQVF